MNSFSSVSVPYGFTQSVTRQHLEVWPESSISNQYVSSLYLLKLMSRGESDNFKITREEWRKAVNDAYEKSGKPCSQIEFHDRACKAIGFKGGSDFNYHQNRIAHKKRIEFRSGFNIHNFYTKELAHG